MFLRSYWSNSFSVLDEDEEVYEADVGEASSVHDRACELYQKIVGINKIREYASKNNRSIVEQNYGVEQVRKCHKSNYYKSRYLRSVNPDLSKTTAHLNGIPNWSETNKVHLVGHSLGAQTIRYLQHLLKVGFFDDDYKGVDRSSWIASISCVSAPLNGTHLPHFFGYDEAANCVRECRATKLFKYKVIAANLLSHSGSQNQANEVVVSQSSCKRELALLYWNVMYEVNVEHFGWNREPTESAKDYALRVWNDNYLQTVTNNAFCDMGLDNTMAINELCIPEDSCYYFSYTTGIQQKVSNSQINFELNPDINFATEDVVGFDIPKINRLRWQDIPRKMTDPTLLERCITILKKSTDMFSPFGMFLRKEKIYIPELYK